MKRCKVDQSAVDMKLNPEKSITDIGLDYGYSSSNYSSVFKKHHDASPVKFRQSIPTSDMPVPFTPERTAHFKTAQEYASRIEIQELSDFFVLYERFIGNYVELEKHWYRFLDLYQAYLQEETILVERFFNDPAITNSSQCIYLYQAYLQEETILVERFFNDPAITNSSQCICDICMTVGEECGLDNLMRIQGGRWAVYHFDGEIKDIFETLQGIFNVWLPRSGYRMAQRYGLNIYRHIDREKHRVRMDLCIPIS